MLEWLDKTFNWIALDNPIGFPGLGIELNPPLGFTVGSLSIRFYGVLIAIGLLLAVWYGLKRCDQFGIKQDNILDGVLAIVPVAIICARAYYCVFSWSEFAAKPWRVFYIWEGGLAIYGAVIGAVIGVIIFCLIKKIKLTAALDLMVLGFLIGQAVGRWGNFINREAYGAVTDTFLRMEIFGEKAGVRECYHPTFLYESLWNMVGFVALHFLSKKRQYDGQIALGYAAWYGLGRTFIEGLRMDSLYWGQMRVSQVLAAVSCFLAVAVLLWMAAKRHDRAKLFVNVVAAREALEAEDPEEEFEEEDPEEEFEEETEETQENS